MQNKKTIFFLINSMENGGAERALSNILPLLAQKYTVYLILLKDGKFYALPKNIKVISLTKIKYNFLMLFLFPFYVWKLKALIKKYQPIKVISFLEIANFVNIISNKKPIISFRTSLFFFKNSFINKIYKFLIKQLYPQAQKIIVNSKENKIDLIKKLNIPPNKISPIYNSIDIKQINKLKLKPLTLPFVKKTTQKIFITVGRLEKSKNIPVLIKIFKNLSTKNILLILGDGPEKENLQKLIEVNDLKKQVFLLGRQKNIYPYLNIANYFIFASKVEGFPNVLIEAMACNLPIITSDFKTGAREIIDQNLKFKQKIKYPYYGPNGVLLSLNNFENCFQKINFNTLRQQKVNLNKFKIKTIITKWLTIIDHLV